MTKKTYTDKIYTKTEFVKELENNKIIEGKSELGSARIKLKKLAPYLILCQHSGTIVSPEIEAKMDISTQERCYEKDLFLDELFEDHPIDIVARHSRYEFDTNRFKEDCIYLTPALCWGIQVYKKALTKTEINTILHMYKEFYFIVDSIVEKIIEKYGICVIYDIHSFNVTHKDRLKKDLPQFNLGTMAVDNIKYREEIDNWLKELNNISITNIPGEARENDVFGGRGGMAYHISRKFNNALIFPTEIQKFFMNEKTLEVYKDTFYELQHKLNKAITNNIKFIIEKHNINYDV